MVKRKAHKVRKHMESWGIVHVIWSCFAFYATTQWLLKWEYPYDEAMIGIAVFWFGLSYLAGLFAKSKPRTKVKTIKKQ